jgi:hypothetical protein
MEGVIAYFEELQLERKKPKKKGKAAKHLFLIKLKKG